jgi:spermidine synthase
MVRLLEPSDSCKKLLWERIFDGTYNRPFILDSGRLRCLQFDLDAVQSAMRLDAPYRLSLAYTRKMMAFLLFNPTPERILLLGLGGGSLAKFCYRQLPLSDITAVELNPDVIALREAFRIPPDDDRFRVIRADSAKYVADVGPSKDIILADACDRTGVAPQLQGVDFYQSAWRRLAEGGVFVMNVVGNSSSLAAHLAKIHHVFGEFLTLRVRSDGNVVVFAFKSDSVDIAWQRLADRAIELKRQFDLEFPRFLQRIALHWKLRGGQPPASVMPRPS